jgi:hypothetical protein
MIESMIEGRQFLFQTIEGTVYHIAKEGVVRVVHLWSSKNHIAAFVDADKENYIPSRLLYDHSVIILKRIKSKMGQASKSRQFPYPTCSPTMVVQGALTNWVGLRIVPITCLTPL